MIIKNYVPVLILFSGLLISCSPNSEEPNISGNISNVTHPTAENIPAKNSELSLVGNTKPVELGDAYNFTNPLLEVGESGSETSNEDNILGGIGGITMHNDKIIYVDSELNQIRFYDKTGNLLSLFEMEGKGPGEFQRPVGVSVKGDHLFIADAFRKINKYRILQDSIEYISSELLNFAPEDMCLINNKVAIRGIQADRDNPDAENSTIIHLYSTENLEHIRSIGNGYKSQNWLAVNQMSDGPIACIPQQDLVVYSYEYMPYVYAMNANGEAKWLIDFRDDFEQGTIVEAYENNTPGITFSPNDQQKFETVRSLTYDASSNLLSIQSSLSEASDSERKVDIKTILIDLGQKIRYRATTDYPIIEMNTDNEILAYRPIPYPQFSLYRR